MAAALRAKGIDDVRVIGQGGDGGTVDIGFACLSGMFERNDDVLYVCYDNEAYMNTGVQRSGATPPGARTAYTKPVGTGPARAGNVFGQGKSAPLIAMAHEIPYVATATVADLQRSRGEGRAGDGASRGPLPARASCPAHSAGEPSHRDTILLARLVKETGLFPVFAAEHGEVTDVLNDPPPGPGRGLPAPAARYAHLFEEPQSLRHDRRDPGVGRSQHPALRPARRGGGAEPS